MKMAKITITVHTERDATWTQEQYDELKSFITAWARSYVKNVLSDENMSGTNPNNSLDDFINDMELPSGTFHDALDKENTRITIKVKE